MSEETKKKLEKQLGQVKRKIMVMSGKGGVGKSTVAANLALALAKKFNAQKKGSSVGLIDADIHGPNIPQILGLDRLAVEETPNGFLPQKGPLGLRVMSMAFFLESKDTPVVWRGPMKMKALEQFLSDFYWGELEAMVIDLPPGTGDEPLSIMQLIPNISGVVIVTTPQEISLLDTGKALGMARLMKTPVLGVIENMSEFVCPDCGSHHAIFGTGGGQRLADKFNVKFLGKVPFNPVIREKEDKGITEAFSEFLTISEELVNVIDHKS